MTSNRENFLPWPGQACRSNSSPGCGFILHIYGKPDFPSILEFQDAFSYNKLGNFPVGGLQIQSTARPNTAELRTLRSYSRRFGGGELSSSK